jgi:hypothetical protein
MNAHVRKRLVDMPPAQQAGILCNDPQFQRFAAIRCGLPGQHFTASAAAQYLRDCCKIDSRKELNASGPAQTQLSALRTEFDAWSGKIASPR